MFKEIRKGAASSPYSYSEQGDVAQKKEHALQVRIKNLIEKDFSDISLSSVVLILEELTAEYEHRARKNSSRSSVAESSSPGKSEPEQHAAMGLFHSESTSSPDFPEIGVSAENDAQLAQLLNQIVNIGALMLQVDEPLQLNEQVSLVVEYGPSDFSMIVLGRVVNISPRGTALEITKLSRDDRAALEQMYRHYQHHLEPASSAPVEQESSNTMPLPSHRAPASASQEHEPLTPNMRRTAPVTKDQALDLLQKHSAQDIHQTVPVEPQKVGTGTAEGGPFSRMRSTINDQRLTMRRQVALIEPDEKVITSSNLAEEEELARPTGSMTEEFYGPERRWFELDQDPDRVEELVGDRVMDILLQLSGHHFTGIVELEHSTEDREKAIQWRLSFDSGFLVEAVRQPRLARMELGHMLLLANRVDKLHLSMAAAHAEDQGNSLGQSLLDLELVTPTVLRHAIAGRLTFLLRLLCNTEAGTIRIFEDQKLPPGFLPVPTLRVHVAIERTIFQLIYESLRQLSSNERKTLSSVELDTYPETLSEEYERIERALGEDTNLLSTTAKLAHGRRRLREVFTESVLSSADTFAVIFALHRMGLLRFDRSLHHTVVRERFRENVTVKYLSVHKASYFEVLNVHWSSYDEVVQRAYDELLIQFDPKKVPEGLEKEVHERVHEIRERVKSAYQVLAKREHRHTYRSRIMPEYKLAHAIPLFLKQSELAERRQQWDEARDSVQRVIELEPQNAAAAERIQQIDSMALRSRKSLSESSLN